MFAFLVLIAALASPVEETVKLETRTGAIEGTLMLPATRGGSVPVALIVAGSGPTDRNGNSLLLPGANDSLKMLAAGLAEHGIASLRFDKRGVSRSSAAGYAEAELRLTTYVDDAAGWVSLLRRDPRFSRVVIVGHSEGSLIGMLAAQRAPVAGFVSIAGLGRSAGATLRDQLRGQLSKELYAESERVLRELEAGRPVDDPPPLLGMLFRQSVQPYLISWLTVDPLHEIAKLDMPVLIVQGTTDVQTTLTDAELLHLASPRSEVVVMRGMNHIFKGVEGSAAKQLPTYSDPKLPLVPELVPRIASFIKTRRR